MTDTADTPQSTFAAQALDLAKTLGAAVLIAGVLRVALFEPFTIPSASMEPGLLTGDYIVVSKWDYGWSRYSIPFGPPLFAGRVLQARGPQRGDVVVFRLPRDPQAETLIKRVIGLPGDRVRVRDGEVFVNGRPIVQTDAGAATDPDPNAPGVPVTRKIERRADGQPYVTFDRGPGRPGDDTDDYLVPAGRYLVMGDNRDNSLDSRWPEAVGVGFVPAENIVGRARIVLASWRGASILKPWTWANLDLGRLLKPIR